MKYITKTFDLPVLEGISAKQVEVHLALYKGYVVHTNLVMEKIAEMSVDKEKNAYAITELRRRFAFEFDGMRMHEYYFEQFIGGVTEQETLGEKSMESKLLYFPSDAESKHQYQVSEVDVRGKVGRGDPRTFLQEFPVKLLTNHATEKYGSVEKLIEHVKEVAMSRGIGWTVLYFDPIGNTLHTAWVSDHELGHLSGLPILLALDMWEHAFMVDYVPAEKKNYIEAFFKNLNWSVVEGRLAKTR